MHVCLHISEYSKLIKYFIVRASIKSAAHMYKMYVSECACSVFFF